MRFEEALKAMREGKRVKRPCYSVEYFMSCFKYLGKSKANINELFEVEDEFKS